MIKFLCILASFLIHGVTAIQYSIIEPDGESPFSLQHLGENFGLISKGPEIYGVVVRQGDGTFVKRAGGDLNLLNDLSGSTLSIVSSCVVKKISNDMLFGYCQDSTNVKYQYFRLTYDYLTDTFGTPEWSSTLFDNNVANVISTDLNKIAEYRLVSTTRYVDTYKWDGSDYVFTSSVTSTKSTSSANIYIGENMMLVGRPSDTSCSGCNNDKKGSVELYSWDGVNNRWETTPEHIFTCPDVSGNAVCRGFGKNVWGNEAKDIVVISAPDSYYYSSYDRSGSYVKFTHDGTSWTTPTYNLNPNFPDAYASSSVKCGTIISNHADPNGCIVLDSSSDWYSLVGSDGYERKLHVKPPYALGTSVTRNTANIYGNGRVVGFHYNVAGYQVNSIVILTYSLKSSEMYFPDSLKIIDSPTTDSNRYFGKYSAVSGDYVATCSTAVYHDTDTTAGVLSILKKNLATGEYDLVDEIGPGSLSKTNINFCNSPISFDGSTVVVGARSEDVEGVLGSGVVYVFDFDGTTLSLNTKFLSPTLEQSQYFGYYVTVSGDKLVIGSYYTDVDGFSNRGQVYESTKTGSTWNPLTILQPPVVNTLDASDQFGKVVDTDGTKLCVTALAQGGTGHNRGLVVVYSHNGTGWEIEQEIKGYIGITNFAKTCSISGDWLAVGSSYATISMFKWSNNSWTLQEEIQMKYVTMGSTTVPEPETMKMRGDILVLGDKYGTYNNKINEGITIAYLYNGTHWDNDDIKFYTNPNKESTDISQVANHVNTDGSSIVWSNHAFITNNYGVGRAFIHTIFITCTETAQCEANQYCTPDDSCSPQKACVEHFDCVGELRANRLPYCDKDVGLCKDVYAGTCSSGNSCDSKHKKIKALQTKLGSITQYVDIGNITRTREVVKRLYSDLTSNVTISQNLTTFVSGTESANLPIQLFQTYNDDATLLDEIKKLVCPPEVLDMCEISQGSRRRLGFESGGRELQSSGSITVEITYEIDSALYDGMVNNSTTFSDGSEFEQALAAALGLSTDNVTVSAVEGQLVVEYIVSEEAQGDDPLLEENLAALQQVFNSLNTITDTVVDELGVNQNDIVTQAVDFCEGRDCNGRGTCDPNTGICECDTPEYWGINCETLVNCGTGERDNTTAYCICEYPEYGKRCQYTKDCTC